MTILSYQAQPIIERFQNGNLVQLQISPSGEFVSFLFMLPNRSIDTLIVKAIGGNFTHIPDQRTIVGKRFRDVRNIRIPDPYVEMIFSDNTRFRMKRNDTGNFTLTEIANSVNEAILDEVRINEVLDV